MVHFKEQIDCVNNIEVDTNTLLQSVHKLGNDVQAINSKVDELQRDINTTKEIIVTRDKNFKMKQLVKKIDAQLEQERELRYKCEADEQKHFIRTMKSLNAIITGFTKEEL